MCGDTQFCWALEEVTGVLNVPVWLLFFAGILNWAETEDEGETESTIFLELINDEAEAHRFVTGVC